ncbi:hypothetical protein FZEAL_3089 [Fusarium zealandicum]|uniref:Uncharacterized protein n=1 Tax=Fusarium zealandicum TaxID=1053134 RepID=A0A8H4UPE2_9HYPO|nr:hypothetical protein FZEAL_3089 [Fusarium zealandicum]
MSSSLSNDVCPKAVEEAGGQLGGCQNGINQAKRNYESICDPCFEKQEERRLREREQRNTSQNRDKRPMARSEVNPLGKAVVRKAGTSVAADGLRVAAKKFVSLIHTASRFCHRPRRSFSDSGRIATKVPGLMMGLREA